MSIDGSDHIVPTRIIVGLVLIKSFYGYVEAKILLDVGGGYIDIVLEYVGYFITLCTLLIVVHRVWEISGERLIRFWEYIKSLRP